MTYGLQDPGLRGRLAQAGPVSPPGSTGTATQHEGIYRALARAPIRR
ncbi:MAG: hypothetical protein ACRDKA_00285 [Actinomycetota bacterium]